MAYQNIYFDRSTYTMHIWDDVKGHFTIPYVRYGYIIDEFGDYDTLYGQRAKKVYNIDPTDKTILEHDVISTTRTLIDMYTDTDEPSTGHRVLTYDIEVEMKSGVPDVVAANNTITSIACHDGDADIYYVFILDVDGRLSRTTSGNRNIIPCRTEHDLLMSYLHTYRSINPTIVTGWNINGFDTPYLYNRITKVLGSSYTNMLSPIGMVEYRGTVNRYIIAGVSYLDYLMLYKKFTFGELDNYRLDTVAIKEIKRGKIEYIGSLDTLFQTDIEKFIEYNVVDVELIVDLDRKLKFIQLCRAICHIGHVTYEEIAFSSKYLEGAILTYLKRRNIVAPNKPRRYADADDEGVQFEGAYVKDPVPGKYDWVYDLDLTSLYPSIIMSLNISPETKIGKINDWDFRRFVNGELKEVRIGKIKFTSEEFKKLLEQDGYRVATNGVIYRGDTTGCIPDILSTWFKKRVEYRALESKYDKEGNKDLYTYYNTLQHVQKILLNSLYGVLGLKTFRFYDLDNAEAVTLTGRTVIKMSADAINMKYNQELGTDKDYNIYIDTDSCFFSAVPLLDKRHPDWSSYSQDEIIKLVDNIAGESQAFVNTFYDHLSKVAFNIDPNKHHFQIKKEFVARSGFWVSKKRYAQWIVAENGNPRDQLAVKGLDVVRSSFPKEFSRLMTDILKSILKGETRSDIIRTIAKCRDSLTDVDVTQIAKNTAVKDIAKYYDAKDTNLLSFKSKTPAHVKASISYNRLLKHLNCSSEFTPIVNGEKVKWVYLTSNPYALTEIAFKGYQDPPEILDLIKTYTDYRKMFDSELETKLNSFFTALGWVDYTRADDSVIDEFFSF